MKSYCLNSHKYYKTLFSEHISQHLHQNSCYYLWAAPVFRFIDCWDFLIKGGIEVDYCILSWNSLCSLLYLLVLCIYMSFCPNWTWSCGCLSALWKVNGGSLCIYGEMGIYAVNIFWCFRVEPASVSRYSCPVSPSCSLAHSYFRVVSAL